MDVIDFLTQDHQSLKGELQGIEEHILDDGLREKIRGVMAHYQLHEEIEDVILDHLEKRKHTKRVMKILKDYENDHKKLWALYEQLSDAMGRDVLLVKRDFFIFYAATVGHMKYEESRIFPMIQKLIERDVLEKMGDRAAMRLIKFRASE